MLFCYLGLFAWNARTGYLDTIAERSGLEIVAYVLSPVVWVKDQIVDGWHRYVALIDVAEENGRLRDDLRRARMHATMAAEDAAELERLRRLLGLEALRERPAFAARVISGRFGPLSARKTFTINKGYLDGAVVGTPVATRSGVVGRVLRSAPHAATVLMVNDSGFRVAVISQESRTPGILTGSAGPERLLEVAYVAQTARVTPGELLITAGIGSDFPKGIPVGVITRVEPGNDILFQRVYAHPVADLDRLEEVMLLLQEDSGPPLVPTLPGPPAPSFSILPPWSPGASPEAENEETPQPDADAPAPLTDAASPLPTRTPSPVTPSERPSRAAGERNPGSGTPRPAAVIDSFQPNILQGAPVVPAPGQRQ